MYKLRTISIKTQVRRLKYFSIFIDFLGTDGLQKELLELKILNWSNTNREGFQKLISPTGEISKKSSKIKSQSFQNYLVAIRKLNLIEENSIYIQTTRIGQVLYTLMKKFPGNSDPPTTAYQLSSLEKAFFLYNILLNDADIFITVLRMLYEEPGKPLNNYLKSYQKYFISRLKQKLNVLRPPDSDKALEALERVMGWRSPERYCEDIVPPRLHWMIDLCLLSDKYELNPQGKAIYEHFPIIEKDIRDIGAEWIENSLADLLSCFFIEREIKMWSALGSAQKDEVITESLFYALKYFSVFNIPRLSVPQTFLFTTLFLLYQKNIKIEFSDISNWIGFEKIINDKKIGLRMAARPEESYIRILNA
ncbi:MAG TPA: hypothetical protein VK186_26450 [Candidatus Deferrimicrobium sp.]|nr:hypothetical protein [Candidatus Kapabacteria bacterium]HLP62409.1 hypothetical protein [Candidatus Deferrimicrobium sp.]